MIEAYCVPAKAKRRCWTKKCACQQPRTRAQPGRLWGAVPASPARDARLDIASAVFGLLQRSIRPRARPPFAWGAFPDTERAGGASGAGSDAEGALLTCASGTAPRPSPPCSRGCPPLGCSRKGPLISADSMVGAR
jgi:hypothetical protein